jgi:DNA-binding NtrC family response regulator
MAQQEATFVLQVLGEETVPRRRIYLPPGRHSIGASRESDVHLPVAGVSRHHGALEVLPDGGAVLTDAGSHNGTYVGGRQIRRVALLGGETISFGSLAVSLEALDSAHARIAVAAPAPSALGSDAVEAAAPSPPRAALDRADPSTVGLSLEERLLRSLRQIVTESAPEAPVPTVPTAVRLAELWFSDLLLERVEIHRGEAVVALCGEETVEPPGLEMVGSARAGEAEWRLRLWGHAVSRLKRLEPFLALALDLLDLLDLVEKPFRSPAPPSSGQAAAVPPPDSRTDLPGAGSHNPEMIRLCRRAAKVAAGDIPILILGESGSGKEVLAHWIHQRSPRSQAPFVALNCAALPRELLEAELFGIEKGVATGVGERRGLLEEAHGGTLFLDEIGDMAADTQAKVLRVLENQTLYRVGGRTPVTVDVRFLAATHRNLEQRIEAGDFRQDLYHRLAAFVVPLPSLRERPEDILLLATHFFHREVRRTATASPGMTRAALSALSAYRWPGNVRELHNEIKKAVLLLEPDEPLGLVHLADPIRQGYDGAEEAPLTLEAITRRAQRQALTAALAAADDDPNRAMEQLGISRATFYRKLKELGL